MSVLRLPFSASTRSKPPSGSPAGFYFMKITLETDYTKVAIEMINGGKNTIEGTELQEAFELFRHVLLGAGFRPDNVEKLMNENRD